MAGDRNPVVAVDDEMQPADPKTSIGAIPSPRRWAALIRCQRVRTLALRGRKSRSNSPARSTEPTIVSSGIVRSPIRRSPVRPSAATTSSNGSSVLTSPGWPRSRDASRASAA